jgi:hypothetical protein
MRYLLIFLMLCLPCWAVRNATTYFFGGTSSSADNGGGGDTSLGTTVVGANGAPVSTTTNATWTVGDGVMTKVGAFTNTAIGMIVNIVSGTHMVAGRYIITARSNDTITIATAAGTENADHADIICNVGGARPATDAVLNAFVGADTIENLAVATLGAAIDVKIYAPSLEFDDTWTFNTNSRGGSATYPVKFWACDSAYQYTPGSVVINPNGASVTNLVTSPTEVYTYMIWNGFVFDGEDVSEILMHNNTASYWVFNSCEFKRSDSTRAVLFDEPAATLIMFNCTIHDNNAAATIGAKIDCPATLANCRVYDNLGSGVTAYSFIYAYACSFSNNGVDGLLLGGTSDALSIMGCLFSANVGDGIEFVAGSDAHLLNGNMFFSNGGFGVNGVDNDHLMVFTGNQFWNNTGGAGVNNDTRYDTAAELLATGNSGPSKAYSPRPLK